MMTKSAVRPFAEASSTSVCQCSGSRRSVYGSGWTASTVIVPPESTVTLDASQYGARPLVRWCPASHRVRPTLRGGTCLCAAAMPSIRA